jgi:hypothetical protein
MHTVAPILVSALQFQQNLSPAFGGVPQTTHIIALSETSFPQFLQYIISIIIFLYSSGFSVRPVFVVVAGLHSVIDI